MKKKKLEKLFGDVKTSYDKEDCKTDLEWLKGMGCDTDELEPFILELITSGFNMTRKEYTDFMKEMI